MKIATLAIHSTHGWSELGTDALAPGLNVFHGASTTGKTTLADLATHALYGRRFMPAPSADAHSHAPQGEVVVDCRGKHFRLRRSHDATAGERLTVAALDQSAVDQETVRRLVACLSPTILRPLFAVNFRETPPIEWLLSPEFSQEFRAAPWRLKWAPPSVDEELRPIYARLRALETDMKSLVRRLGTDDEQAATDQKTRAHKRNRRASHFLAQLTDGELQRLQLNSESGEARVVTRDGDSLPVASLWSTQRDQVYLSLCLALVSALHRHGARLPLVLDEPFARLDAKSSAALVEVLGEFCDRGHQVLVFTARDEVAERTAAMGAKVCTMQSLREEHAEHVAETIDETIEQPVEDARRRTRRRVKTTRLKHREAG